MSLINYAKDYFVKDNSDFNQSLLNIINYIENVNDTEDVLCNELILLHNLDLNIYTRKKLKIENMIGNCQRGLEEYILFRTNKEQYLETIYRRNQYNRRGVDINRDTIFEYCIKQVIKGLRDLKKLATLSHQMQNLYDVRVNRLKQICKNYTQDRKAFLEEHIK